MHSSVRADAIAIGVLVAAVGMAFLPSVNAEWLNWDDEKNFLINDRWRGLDWAQLEWMWTARWMGHYQPLTWMSLGLGYVIHGLEPFGYHVENVAMHGLSTVLFFSILRTLFPAMGTLGAAAGAAFFGVHPHRVESVAWISERRDVLSLPLALGSVWAWLAWVRDRRRSWLVFAVALQVASLASKAHAVTLPAVLLVLDIWPLGRFRPIRAALLEKLPFVAASLLFGIVALGAQEKIASHVVEGQMMWSDRIITAVYGYSVYPGKLLVPTGMTPLYPLAETEDLPVGVGLASLAGLTVLALAVVRKFPAVLVAWVLYLGILFPVSGLLHTGPQAVADRYTYFAGLPFAALFGGAAAMLARKNRWWLLPFAGYLAVLGTQTYAYSEKWQSSVSLWRHAATLDPGNPKIQFNLAGAYLRAGRPDAALPLYEALRVEYSGRNVDLSYASALDAVGRTDEAIAVVLAMLPDDPGYSAARRLAGSLLIKQGNPAKAVEVLETGVLNGATGDDLIRTLHEAKTLAAAKLAN